VLFAEITIPLAIVKITSVKPGKYPGPGDGESEATVVGLRE
jgi:hypothetical protein